MKKLISIIISVSLLLCILPSVSFAQTSEPSYADGAYIITNAEELAWFAENFSSASSSNAVLTNDIDLTGVTWTSIGNSSNKYSGTFDGNGHTISGLNISANDKHLGLFGYIGSGGTVTRLTVQGDVEYTGTSSSGYYAGGIAGQNDGTIEYCISDVNVTGKGYCGGIAAYCNGGRIAYSANRGNITGTSNYAYSGGIAGMTNSTGTEIECVYNTGNITSNNYAGGLIGYIMSVKMLQNAYSTGTVTCTLQYKGGCVGNASSYFSRLTNCYFLKNDSVNSDLAAAKGKTDTENVGGKTEDELKSPELIAALESFDTDTQNINNGYPILKWQKPEVRYNAVITVSPANTHLTLVNSSNEEISGECSDGVYSFNNLAAGEYSYTASYDEEDYIPQSGSFTIDNTDYSVTITLVRNTYKLTCTVEPSDANFVLTSNDTELTPDTAENGRYEYTLPNGEYTYTASAFGFTEKTGAITVNRENQEAAITLERLPSAKVTFSMTDKTSGNALNNIRSEVMLGEYAVLQEADGSYSLSEGKYSYTVRCLGYAKKTGEFTVTSDDITAGSKIILLETEPSAVWDGDMDEPKYSDGAWQISTGNELAWFSAFTNGDRTTDKENTSYNAALTSDIDLSNLNWTPINTKPESVFDGCGHTVSGLYINTDRSYQGLFGKNAENAVIKNLTVEGSVKSVSTGINAYTGGICGYNEGQITDCKNKANVVSDGDRTGGICGGSKGTGSTEVQILRCENLGNVSYENGTGKYKGGIAGEAQYTEITECSNSGNISGNGNFNGGIAGRVIAGATVKDCYNTGAVTASAYQTGGVAGGTYMSNYSECGIINCYSVGAVTNTLDTPQSYGALIGYYSGGVVTNCYCLIENDNIEAIGGTDGDMPAVNVKNSADEMRGILETLNTNSNWVCNDKLNNGYPVLQWQNIPPDNRVTVDGKVMMSDSVTVSAGLHRIDIDYTLISGDVENGLLMTALYNSDGTIKSVSLGGTDYIASGEYDLQDGETIKIFFWDGAYAPKAKTMKIQAEI